jgi:hypothetical protein
VPVLFAAFSQLSDLLTMAARAPSCLVMYPPKKSNELCIYSTKFGCFFFWRKKKVVRLDGVNGQVVVVVVLYCTAVIGFLFFYKKMFQLAFLRFFFACLHTHTPVENSLLLLSIFCFFYLDLVIRAYKMATLKSGCFECRKEIESHGATNCPQLTQSTRKREKERLRIKVTHFFHFIAIVHSFRSPWEKFQNNIFFSLSLCVKNNNNDRKKI